MVHGDDEQLKAMRYSDGEMSPRERAEFEAHLKECADCRAMVEELRALKEVTDDMKIADLPEAVWEKYWTGVYNRIERSVAWFLFIAGSLIVVGYGVFKALTDPSLYTVAGLGCVLLVVGLAILMLSVFREKYTVNKNDRYISEVKR